MSQYGFYVDTTLHQVLGLPGGLQAVEPDTRGHRGPQDRGRGVGRRVPGREPRVHLPGLQPLREAGVRGELPRGPSRSARRTAWSWWTSRPTIGCQTCAGVCPFGITQYRPEDEKMDKCDGCASCGKTPEDEPHCVATCPTKALHFGPIRGDGGPGGREGRGAPGGRDHARDVHCLSGVIGPS